MGKINGRTVRWIRKRVRKDSILLTFEGVTRTGRKAVLRREVIRTDNLNPAEIRSAVAAATEDGYKHIKKQR